MIIRAGARRGSEMARGAEWRSHELTLDVPTDATTLELDFAFDGEGRTWLDTVSLETLP